ncbi:MAG TPA: cupin domain-containing protein [Chloroflexota bacterium]|nr:cupin domain-containing protein [Chloroflexota bacterium]
MEARVRHGNTFFYDDYLEQEDLPIHRAVVGVDDVTKLPRAHWKRTGGNGTFIQLDGTFQSQRGIYVADIPAGGQLTPERHIYEEEIFVLEGQGVAEVWQGNGGKKLTFEWGEGSVFALPKNTWHCLYNGANRPAVFMGVTTAPEVINSVKDIDFPFNCDYDFDNLYADGDRYFSDPGSRSVEGTYRGVIWTTNLIPDSRRALLDDLEQKVSGGQLTGYRMGVDFPHGHISEWPSGRYHKAHYHGPGAILLGLDGEGYVLAWPSALGPHPYQDGHGDQVLKVNWSRNSIYSPPNAYFHQHFNTGPGPAKHVAVYGAKSPMGVYALEGDDGGFVGYVSYKQGGTLIEYEDEDPQVRRDYKQELRKKGIECAMPTFQAVS